MDTFDFVDLCPYCGNRYFVSAEIEDNISTFDRVYDRLRCEKCGKAWFRVYSLHHEEDVSGGTIVRNDRGLLETVLDI